MIGNAHLDPVWLWEWQEGAGEALSTFRQAAEFCEKHDCKKAQRVIIKFGFDN